MEFFMNPTPEFFAAVRDHSELAARLGAGHPDVFAAFTKAFMLSPDFLIDEVHADLLATGLLPPSDTVLADGSRGWTSRGIAEQLVHRREKPCN